MTLARFFFFKGFMARESETFTDANNIFFFLIIILEEEKINFNFSGIDRSRYIWVL